MRLSKLLLVAYVLMVEPIYAIPLNEETAKRIGDHYRNYSVGDNPAFDILTAFIFLIIGFSIWCAYRK